MLRGWTAEGGCPDMGFSGDGDSELERGPMRSAAAVEGGC